MYALNAVGLACSLIVFDAGKAVLFTNFVFNSPSCNTSSACMSPSPSQSRAASSSGVQLPDCDNVSA